MTREFVTITRANVHLFSALFRSVFNSPPWNDGWSEQAAVERLTAFAEFPQFRGLGLMMEGKPVALILGWGERWVEGWVFHVKEMCIRNDLQRQGLGTQLLSTLEEQLTTDGYTATYLQTGDSAPARFFYENLAYKNSSLVSLSKKLRSSS